MIFKLFFGGNSGRPSSVVKPGDKKWGLTARTARVISVETVDNYLGYTDYTIQRYTLKRSNGSTAYGQQFIDYRGSSQNVTTHRPLKEGDSVVAWWPDKRQGVYNAEVVNNERKGRKKK